jgi:chorismate mutase/prephenate dehydratase
VPVPHGTPARTSLVLAVTHQPGSLAALLTAFANRGVNVAKLESRPVPAAPWKYRFYLDLEGYMDDEPVRSALEEARALTTELRILGTYPAAER